MKISIPIIEAFLLKHNLRILSCAVMFILLHNLLYSQKTIREFQMMNSDLREEAHENANQMSSLHRLREKLFEAATYLDRELPITHFKQKTGSDWKIVGFHNENDGVIAVRNQQKFIKTLLYRYTEVAYYLFTDGQEPTFSDDGAIILKHNIPDIDSPSIAICNENNRIISFVRFDGHESNEEISQISQYVLSLLKRTVSSMK